MNNFSEENLTGVNQEAADANTPLRYLTASSIIGDNVYNAANEHLGSIKNIMLDISTGKIDYYIIEFGGFLGMDTKYFAIPFHLLIVDPAKKRFSFNQSKEALEKAPGFDTEHWPDTNHHDDTYNYWSFMA